MIGAVLGFAVLAGPAWATEIGIVLADGPLVPGLPGEVVLVGTAGAALEAPGAAIAPLGDNRFVVTPPLQARTLTLRATAGADTVTRVVPVAWPEASQVGVRARSDAVARTEVVPIAADGAVEAFAGEGRVDLTAAGSVLRSESDGGARIVGLAFRGPGEDRPAWSAVRLRARVGLPYDVEPGASLAIRVGSRSYGPFAADATGHLDAAVEQWPGEVVADAVFTDALGNTTHALLPLPGGGTPEMLLVPPGRTGRLAWARLWEPDGDVWRGPSPTCEAASGPLAVDGLGGGEFVVLLPPVDAATGLRVRCRVGTLESVMRVEPAAGTPARIQLRVWPEELDADFPAAELRGLVVDVTGEPLPVTGLELAATHGTVRVEAAGPADRTLFAAYTGRGDGTHDADELVARLPLATSQGPVATLRAGASRWDTGGLVVWVAVRDPAGRPVTGASVGVAVGGRSASARSDDKGVAVARLDLAPADGVHVIRASAGRLWIESGMTREGPYAQPPPIPALEARRTLTLLPGRAVDLGIEIQPPLVRAGGGAARIEVAVRDRSGRDVPDAPVVTAEEGVVGAVEARGDGRWEASWTPAPGGRARSVEVSASVDDVRASTSVDVDPAPLRGSVGVWVGGITNLGAVASPSVSLDADLALFGREDLAVRLGAAVWSAGATSTGAEATDRLSAMLYPAFLAAMVRRERRGLAGWVGLGGAAGAEVVRIWSDERLLGQGLRLRAGPVAMLGGGWRTGARGQLVVETRLAWLLSAPVDVGFSGNLGGAGVGIGYREVW